MKKVLVTGAAGFIGGYCAREFAARGWHVFALEHRTPMAKFEPGPGALTVLRGDASDGASLGDAARAAGGFDAAAHCAGRASDVGRREEFRRANLEPVRHLAGLVRAGAVGRVVFVSSTDVYGLRDFSGEAEDALPLQDNLGNPYPEFKIAAERLLREELPPEKYCIIRPAAVWGHGDKTFAPRILDFLKLTPWIIHFGRWRGANRWPLAHVRNVAAAVLLGAEAAAAAGLAVNVIDSERTSADEFYRLLASVYLPERSFKSVTLPFAAGRALGTGITAVSNLLNLDRPFMDPSLYALYAANCSLDFDNTRLKDLFAGAGRALVTRAEGIDELRRLPAL
ncbi:MAG: hypothetical protein A2X32_05240 [Elusimicrobia bacterium GWC2_64_44]|nr:MAG: hypothetical protein A2X32_05240 [Elusimicrobia bacterium GWC2_64_44]